MNSNVNSVSSNPLNPLGLGYPAQAILGVLLAIFIYSVFFSAEYLYRLIKGANKQKTELIPFTASNKSYQLVQNPSAPDNKSVHLSDNERTGVEFSYVFFVYIDKLNGDSTITLKHIFHKGYRSQQNLLGPAVYMLSNTNTMRIFMNTYKKWNNSVDIENIPMKKWVHVAIICESNGLNIFINGNITKRLNFEGSLPYQNYGDIYVLSDKPGSNVGEDARNYPGILNGRLDGMISNLFYYNYALSYTEINEHMNIGPSKKTDPDTQDRPQYLTDNWWVA